MGPAPACPRCQAARISPITLDVDSAIRSFRPRLTQPTPGKCPKLRLRGPVGAGDAARGSFSCRRHKGCNWLTSDDDIRQSLASVAEALAERSSRRNRPEQDLRG